MVDTEFDRDRRLVIHRARGELTSSDMKMAATSVWISAELSSFGVIWDLRDASIGITLGEVLHFDPSIGRMANSARPAGRTAWVVSTDLGESILRLIHREYPWQAEWQFFRTMSDAIEWCAGQDTAGSKG